MKKTITLFLCLLLALSTSMSALASEVSGIAAEQVFKEIYTQEESSFNYMYESAGAYYANYVDGLVENNTYGITQPCIAESWEISEDGTVYTFHIRPGVKWYTHTGEEYGDVTAHDFVYSAKHILTLENGSKTADILTSMFVNAAEFYNGECGWEDVGVKALDDLTLQYTLLGPVSYFISMLTYVCFLPANEEFVTACGDKWGTSNEYWLYNGCFILTEFQPQFKHVAVKNENYWDADRVHITRIERVYNTEANTLGPIMVQTGEVTKSKITADMIDSWYSDPELSTMVRPDRPGTSSYQYFYLFNFWPNFDESVGGSHETWLKCANNYNFRMSFFHALDRINALQTRDPYSPEDYLANTITTKDFVYANGVSYSQMGDLAKYSNTESYDPAKALEFKALAMEELAKDGVEFPVKVYCPYNEGSTTNWRQRAVVVEQQMENLLGQDYIDIVIEGYPSTDFLNTTRRAGNFAWMECYWGADYQDPATYIDPFRLGQVYNFMWFADGWAERAEEGEEGAKPTRSTGFWKNYIYEDMADAAAAEKVDLAKRYEGLANVEAWLLDTGIVIPLSNDDMGFTSAFFNPFDFALDPFGISDEKYKDVYIYNHQMGMDEYEEAYEQWLVERDEALAELAAK